MTTRRRFLRDIGLLAAASATPLGSASAEEEPFELDPRFKPQIVEVLDELPGGEIHVDSDHYFVYLTLGEGRAIRYGCAVGLAGREFRGEAVIGWKTRWPTWTPTQNMLRRDPAKYGQWASGMPGGPDNPLGARALYLFQDGKDTLYRIHGTPQPWTIGRSASSGCVRMFNAHVSDLYERVEAGTRVVVY